jgi:anti-sigma-K factor RskA
MSEIGPTDGHLAFLYVSGEMNAAEMAAFERRLGEEQPLREALCQAVELMQSLEGLAPPTPRPAYRQRVRQRLRPAGWWRWLARRQMYRGHPALWSGLGAAAALLAILSVPPSLIPTGPRTPAAPTLPPVAEQTKLSQPEAPAEEPADLATIEEAEMWASMHNSDHLVRAHEEEGRRRDRRLVHGDHVIHLPGSPSVRH